MCKSTINFNKTNNMDRLAVTKVELGSKSLLSVGYSMHCDKFANIVT